MDSIKRPLLWFNLWNQCLEFWSLFFAGEISDMNVFTNYVESSIMKKNCFCGDNIFTNYVENSILKKNYFYGDNVTKILMEHSIVVPVKAQCPY